MIQPDEELWGKLNFPPERYEYVKLSWKVAKILKRKVGQEVLLSYYYIDGHKRVKMLNYVSYDGISLHKGPGYCSEDTENCVHKWETIAEEIAESFPKYAVKHRKK